MGLTWHGSGGPASGGACANTAGTAAGSSSVCAIADGSTNRANNPRRIPIILSPVSTVAPLQPCYDRQFSKMRLPRVYPILDTETLAARGISLQTAAAAMLDGGAGILQIRHKGHWSRDMFAAATDVARLCRENGVPLIVNDRADFALLLDAGLHVG